MMGGTKETVLRWEQWDLSMAVLSAEVGKAGMEGKGWCSLVNMLSVNMLSVKCPRHRRGDVRTCRPVAQRRGLKWSVNLRAVGKENI